MSTRSADELLAALVATSERRPRLLHVSERPGRAGRRAPWPAWLDPQLEEAWRRLGIAEPWEHQVRAADLAHSGRSVVLATGTASGKSLGYLMPALTAALDGRSAPTGRGATVLYVSPTKALAADQLARLQRLAVRGLRVATYDGDTPEDERRAVRDHGHYVLTNPDMLHLGILGAHERWASFLRALRFVVIDECHVYRGVFGSHVAAVLRRLRRVAHRYGSDPVFVLASATVSEPDVSGRRLTGVDVVPVTDDTSTRGRALLALWEPPLTALRGEHDAPVRRSATAETADLLTDLTVEGARTLAFVRSRRAAEAVAITARRHLSEVDPHLGDAVAAYRAGYLPEERRRLEEELRSGRRLALATTNALELGVDVSGLDAVLLAGYPGTRTAFWQQVGRAGRSGQDALGVLVARDDPLDTYLVHHPEALLDRPVEATVLDPDNPYVLAPHLAAAAAELPLTEADLPLFGPAAPEVVEQLERGGLLRRRPTGWYWTRHDRAHDLADLRGTGGGPVRVVEAATGRLLGTVDRAASHSTVHRGAVYLHQGETYLVRSLDVDDAVAFVDLSPELDWTTTAREVNDVRVLDVSDERPWGPVPLRLGVVQVTSQVVGFLRRRVGTGEVLGEEPLDLPARTLRTVAVWWTATEKQLARAQLDAAEVPGAAHAAEHASIGLLPLFATCDRWDVGGLSTALHPDTGLCTVFVHDGHPGGAGFAERGYRTAEQWLTATLATIRDCECPDGCPSCVQSPKCGNGNDPLDKAGAGRLLAVVLQDALPRQEA
ncbi:MAG: DEAD/DEAH box helicase [Actinomycetes bacterium]